MDVVIRPTNREACWFAAQWMDKAIRMKPHLTLGLATGRTMEGLYDMLVQRHRENKLDFSRVRSFNLDEYIGLPPSDPGSYRYYMNHHLFDRVNMDKQSTFLPDGMAVDLPAECARYEGLIAQSGGIDLQLLGLGKTGHIGFNEPLSAFQSRTRPVVLTPLTMSENRGAFKNPETMPHRAISMGIGTILEAGALLMLVTGEAKSDILARAVEGPLTAMVPASALQFHPRVHVICDAAAAGKLKNRDDYDRIFLHEPEWAPYRDGEDPQSVM